MRFPILRPFLLGATLLAPLLATGCIDTDAAVFVEPTITSPAATVDSVALGVTAAGSFTLKLHLGPRASGPSTVDLGALVIVDAERKGTVAEGFTFTSDTPFPVTVNPDSDVEVAITFDTGSKTLPADTEAKLCDPAGVVIQGTIEDTLQNRATPVASEVFEPTCP